jgi:hypothetical protein
MTSHTAVQHHTRFWGNSRHGGRQHRRHRTAAHIAWPAYSLAGLAGGSGSITSPQAPREPGRARVDAALPVDELIQRLGIRLVGHRVPHHPRPLAPSTLVGFCWIRGAPDDGGDQTRATSSFDLPAGLFLAWPGRHSGRPAGLVVAIEQPRSRRAQNGGIERDRRKPGTSTLSEIQPNRSREDVLSGGVVRVYRSFGADIFHPCT